MTFSTRRNLTLPLGCALVSVAIATLATVSPTYAQRQYRAFGDSITFGTGDDPERELIGYPARLEGMLMTAGRNVVVTNHGLPGENTIEGLTRIDGVLALGGRVLLLMEGTNDINNGLSLETTLFNLAAMADKADLAGFEEVILATVIPRPPSAKNDPDNVLTQLINEAIRSLAGAREADLVDNFEILTTVSMPFDTYYSDDPDDRVGHPNSAGYDLMAETFFNVIEGIDTVPPVIGFMDPRDQQAVVPPEATIRVELWDFGTGIDADATALLVNGEEVVAASTADADRVHLLYEPPQPLIGLVRVAVRSADLAVPPNELDREIASFIIEGSVFLDSDLDLSGRVDGADLVILALGFGKSLGENGYNPSADINADGIIDGEDLALLAAEFANSTF